MEMNVSIIDTPFFLNYNYYTCSMTYKTIDTIFQQINEDTSAAEAHGMATGMLCIDCSAEAASWLNEAVHEPERLLEEERSMLDALFEKTRELLEGDSFEFDLLLPEDDCPLYERAAALKSWCQGFSFGVGYSSSTSDWPGETGEILKDIMEFSRMDTEVEGEGEGEGEEDENAFMEINEYLRAAVLLLAEELSDNGDGERVVH